MCHSYNSGATPRKSTRSLSMMAGGGRSGERRDGPQLQHARLALFFVPWSLAPDKLEGPMEFSRLWKETKKESEVAQLCPTLCDPMDCSLPGSSVHGILQARILEFPFPSPEDLPNPGIEPGSPALQADSLPSEPPGKPNHSHIHHFLIEHKVSNRALSSGKAKTHEIYFLSWGGLV